MLSSKMQSSGTTYSVSDGRIPTTTTMATGRAIKIMPTGSRWTTGLRTKLMVKVKTDRSNGLMVLIQGTLGQAQVRCKSTLSCLIRAWWASLALCARWVWSNPKGIRVIVVNGTKGEHVFSVAAPQKWSIKVADRSPVDHAIPEGTMEMWPSEAQGLEQHPPMPASRK
jgi:hypothetical protein